MSLSAATVWYHSPDGSSNLLVLSRSVSASGQAPICGISDVLCQGTTFHSYAPMLALFSESITGEVHLLLSGRLHGDVDIRKESPLECGTHQPLMNGCN